jgi:hypothetical protein
MIAECLLIFATSLLGATPAPCPPQPGVPGVSPEATRQANLARLLLGQQETRLQVHRGLGTQQDRAVQRGLRIVRSIPTRPALARLIPAINRQIMSLQRRLDAVEAQMARGQAAARSVLARLQQLNALPRQTESLQRLETALTPFIIVAEGRPPATPIRI